MIVRRSRGNGSIFTFYTSPARGQFNDTEVKPMSTLQRISLAALLQGGGCCLPEHINGAGTKEFTAHITFEKETGKHNELVFYFVKLGYFLCSSCHSNRIDNQALL